MFARNTAPSPSPSAKDRAVRLLRSRRMRLRRSDHLESLLGRRDRRLPADAVTASLGCGNPDRAHRRCNPARPCSTSDPGGGIDVLLSAKRVGPDREGVRPRHDRRDARAGAGEPAQSRRDERRVPQREIEAIPLPDNARRRDHLQLRDQPVGRQGRGAARGVSRAQAGRPLCRVRRRRPR